MAREKVDQVDTTQQVFDLIRSRSHANLLKLVSEGRSPEEAKRYRASAEGILKELTSLENLRILSIQNASAYASKKQAHEVIELFLDEIKRPATLQEIIEGVGMRGFRGGVAGSKRSITNAVTNFLTGTGKDGNKMKIKRLHGRIGFADWDDEMFADPVESPE